MDRDASRTAATVVESHASTGVQAEACAVWASYVRGVLGEVLQLTFVEPRVRTNTELGTVLLPSKPQAGPDRLRRRLQIGRSSRKHRQGMGLDTDTSETGRTISAWAILGMSTHRRPDRDGSDGATLFVDQTISRYNGQKQCTKLGPMSNG